MKLLSLNAHSWCEEHQTAKIMQTAEFIVEQNIDVVAIQEANQLLKPLFPPRVFSSYAGPSSLDIGADNYVALLAEACSRAGADYDFYWLEAHEGFGYYDEGVGMLIRRWFNDGADAEVILLADYPYQDIRRRVALAVPVNFEEERLWVITGHFSWWEREGEELFAHEWKGIEDFLRKHPEDRAILLGDLNNPAHIHGEGYDLVREAGWLDTRDCAELVVGEHTIPGKIAGWEKKEPVRIDYVLSRNFGSSLKVLSHTVVLDGQASPLVSDHYGVLVECSVS